jgi:hypothetical protein
MVYVPSSVSHQSSVPHALDVTAVYDRDYCAGTEEAEADSLFRRRIADA